MIALAQLRVFQEGIECRHAADDIAGMTIEEAALKNVITEESPTRA